MANTILSGDFTVFYSAENNQKRIVWTGSSTGTRTLNELYSALLKLFDDPAQSDDAIPIRAVTPDIYQIINQWFIDDTTVEHLTGGALSSSGWVSGTDEHVLLIGADFATSFSGDDVGRTIVGGTTGDTGTVLDFNSQRNLIWIRPTDPTSGGDAFDHATEAYSIQNDAYGRVWQVDTTGPTFVDETTDANNTTNADWEIFPSTEEVGDYVALGFSQKFSKLIFDNANGTAGVGGAVAWEYWDGSAWQVLSSVTDGTSAFTAGPSDGQEVTWTAPSDWARLSLNGSAQLYYIRARITTTYSTNPIYDQGFVGGQGAGSFQEHPRHGAGSAAGEASWTGITSIGAISENTEAYIFQEDPDEPEGSFKESKVIATKGSDVWWPRESHVDIVLKTKEAASVFGPRPGAPTQAVATFFMRQYSKLYSHFIARSLSTQGGNTVVPFATSDDLNNPSGHRTLNTDASTGTWNSDDIDTVIQEQGNPNNKAVITDITGTDPNFTIEYYLIHTQEDFQDNDVIEDEAQTKTLTVNGAPADTGPATLAVTPTFGATTEDINNGNGARPYSIRIDPSSNSLADVYERVKYLTRRGALTTLLRQDGEEYVGNETQIEYSSQTNAFAEGSRLYDQTSNAVGVLVADHDDGTTGDVILKAVRGTFSTTNTLSDSPSPTQTLQTALQVDASTGTIVDETADAQSAGGADVVPFPGTEEIGDYFAIGGSEVFAKVLIDIATSGVGGTVQWEYWNGTAWQDLEVVANFSDGTSDFTAATGLQELVFSPPGDWTPTTLTDGANSFGPFYMVRARVTTTYSTDPVLDEVRLEDWATAIIDDVRTIVPESASSFGTFAGGTFFGAPGVALTIANLVEGEDQAFQLVDDDGNTQVPPNTVSASISNLVSGDSIAIFRRSGSDINKTQFTLASGNALGNTSITVNETISADNPTNSNSKVRLISSSGQEHRYRYDSYSGSTFTLSAASTGTDDGGGNLTTISDSTATFQTDGVEVGDLVRNTSDGVSFSVAVSVDSETQLTVTDNGTSWNGQSYSVNTLVEDYSENNNAYVPVLERIANATTETNKLVQSTNIDVRAVVRNSSGGSPILPFEQDGTLGSNGISVSAIRTDDGIIS